MNRRRTTHGNLVAKARRKNQFDGPYDADASLTQLDCARRAATIFGSGLGTIDEVGGEPAAGKAESSECATEFAECMVTKDCWSHRDSILSYLATNMPDHIAIVADPVARDRDASLRAVDAVAEGNWQCATDHGLSERLPVGVLDALARCIGAETPASLARSSLPSPAHIYRCAERTIAD